MRRINDAGLALVKDFEGLRLEAYVCPAGVLTIGWGHTRTAKRGQRITEAEAERLLRDDLRIFEEAVDTHLSKDASANAFSAFVSFAFNVGVGGFRRSTALARYNDGDHEAAAAALKWWNKAGGRELPGLVRRREAEARLMLTPDAPPVHDAIPAPAAPSGGLWAKLAERLWSWLFARNA